MSLHEAVESARDLLALHGVQNPPVDPFDLASRLDVVVLKERLNGNTSAMLYRRPGEPPVIGVNSSQTKNRQRFSVAHELGHLLLHPGRPLIVDQVRVNFRDERSSTGTFAEEIEANAFAAELLMPESMIQAALGHFSQDQREEVILKHLAGAFRVSREAVGYRLVNLGLRSGL